MSKELKQLETYWMNKYPTIQVILFPHVEGGKYKGKLLTSSSSADLSADTVGELISQGEAFLRSVKYGG